MATFYIQLQDKLLQISGELTAENISKALGYVPVDSSTLNNYATKDEVSDLVDMSMVEELAQRVDNISFDNLKDNPFLSDGSGELNIVDESGNIIAKIDADGIHSVDFIAGEHKLTDKIDSSALNGYAKESWVTAEITKAATEGKVDLTGYATEQWVEDKNYLTEHQDISHLATKEEVADVDFFDIKNNPITNAEEGNLIFVDESGNIGLKLDKDNNLTVKDVIAGDNILSNKVDKESGKGLSTEDFTTALKNKLQSLSNYDDASITEAVNSLRADFDTLVSGDTSTAIKTFNEIIAFLEGVEDTESLSGIIASIEQQIANIEIPSLDGYATEDYVNQKEQAIQTWVNNKAFATQEDVANIDFYEIKDNPIVNDGDGKLIFADENGNIGLQLEADNTLYVKDVIAGDNILSNKADKSDLEGLATESYVVTKIAEAKLEGSDVVIPVQDVKVNGQTVIKDMVADIDLTPYAKSEDVPSIEGLATEQWVTDKNYLTQHQDISHLASTEYVDEQIANVDVTEQLKDYALKSELPSLEGLATEEYVNSKDTAVQQWVNEKGYTTQEDIANIDFYSIKDNPIINDGDGRLVFADENGNIGLQIEADNTIFVKDVIAGDHALTNKMDIVDNLVRVEDTNGEVDDVPEEVCVKYVTQSLTEEQKSQVRENIDAVSPNEFKTFNGESLIGTGDIELNLDSVINYDLNVKAINHRGFSKQAPENTIPAYIMSKKNGYTYVEGDVSFTSDSVAVLLHDATIDRTSNGSGNITSLSYQKVLQYDFGSWFSKEYAGVKIPTFKEWIILCKNIGLHPYIELKSAGGYTQAQINQVVDEVTLCGMKGKVTYISFSSNFLGYVKNADASARLGFLANSITTSAINTVKNLKTTTNEVFLDIKLAGVTDAGVSSCIANNIPLEVWTVNTEKEILNMSPYINGVTSDNLIAGKVLYNNSLTYVPPTSTYVATESITLSKDTLNIITKESTTLVVTIEPENASEPIVWKSSNTAVATVNDGVVTPLTNGECVISVSSDGKTAECSVVVDFIKYNVTNSLVGCELINTNTLVEIGNTYTTTIKPFDGYSLKNATIEILMGGVNITETSYNNGIINIPNVSGDITINIQCVEVPVYSIVNNLVGCTNDNTSTRLGEGNPYIANFAALYGYKLDGANVTILMGGEDITATNYSNGVLTISEITGDLIITIEAVELQIFTITRNLVGCTSNMTITEIEEGKSYTEVFVLENYNVIDKQNTLITMGGVDVTSYLVGKTLHIPAVNGNIVITVTAIESDETIPVVDLDFANVVNNTIPNIGSGNATYNGTLSTVNTSDSYVVVENNLVLNGHAYANVPYALNNTQPWTVVIRAMIDGSYQKYSRMMRGSGDAPSIYWVKSSGELCFKLANVMGNEQTTHSGNMKYWSDNVNTVHLTNGIFAYDSEMQTYVFVNDTNKIYLYINGSLMASQNASNMVAAEYIGIGDNDTTTTYNADSVTVSNFRVYDSALSADEIRRLLVPDTPATSVSFDVNSLVFNLKESVNPQTITATIEPRNTTDEMMWISSDDSVATVDSGVITPHSVGECIITLMVGAVSATCNVSVVSNDIPATKVELDKTNIVFDNFETQTITATIEPSNTTNTAIWSSSNTSVATVENGVVIPQGIGNCIITLTVGAVSATCNITVNVDASPVVDLKLTNVTDGILYNLGRGGSQYDATIQTVKTGDSFESDDTMLKLNGHAYANVNYGFNSTTPFTIVFKGRISDTSTNTYQRLYRTDVDAPSLYAKTSTQQTGAKLIGATGNNNKSASNMSFANSSNTAFVRETETYKDTHTYIWTNDGTTVNFYIDGKWSASQDVANLTSSTYVGIGDNDSAKNYYANQIEVEKFAIYDRVLTESEINNM